jgi:hypothetical protein
VRRTSASETGATELFWKNLVNQHIDALSVALSHLSQDATGVTPTEEVLGDYELGRSGCPVAAVRAWLDVAGIPEGAVSRAVPADSGPFGGNSAGRKFSHVNTS